jgi:deoxyribodipyrimidine photolyase-related protein
MKLILHRASMKFLESKLDKYEVYYIENQKNNTIKKLFDLLIKNKIDKIYLLEVLDSSLITKLFNYAEKYNVDINISGNPAFLTDIDWIKKYFSNNNFNQTKFYIEQRKRLGVLLENNNPIGGKWSFDSENRKKLPRDIPIPEPSILEYDESFTDAIKYVDKEFNNNPGNASSFNWPINYGHANEVLSDFIENRLEFFGDYQDAITKREVYLFHSRLSSSLNIGLISPRRVLDLVLKYNKENDIPLNSLEGFIRQLIGWREYIRAVYVVKREVMLKSNFWEHKRTIPNSFYNASTGIEPLDDTLKKVYKNAYVHHIERLMILGNFFLLMRIDPKEVYKWFMEMFIDSYEWVMVPNVYGMSQFADYGGISTKPYISSSNYIRRMSDYGKGNWSSIWDSLFWSFIDDYKEKIEGIPRMRVILYNLEKMSNNKVENYRKKSTDF